MRAAIFAMCCAGAVLLAACGGSEAGGKEEPPATAPQKPAGKAVGKESQLVGTWLADEEGDLAGMEFAADGKVVVTLADMGGGVGQALTFDYAVMEGGRVRITMPGGVTEIYACSLDGSRMTFEPESPGMMSFDCSRFVRLKGQTLVEARRAKAQERAKEAKEAARAVAALLGKPGLALVNADPRMHLDRFALELEGGNGSWTGKGYVEGNVVVLREVQVWVQEAPGPGQPPAVTMAFGRVLGPPGMHQMQPETLTLAAQGEGKALEVTDGSRALRSDPATHKELVERYARTAAEREAAMARFADSLGSFARLEGELRYPGNPTGPARRMTLGLLRMEGQPGFLIADMGRNPNPTPAAFAMPAAVELDGDRPLLNLGNQQVLWPGADGDATTLRGSFQGSEGPFQVAEKLSKEELTRRRAVAAEFLDKELRAGLTLRGSVTEDDRPEAPVRPIRFALTSDAGRNLGGSCFVDHLGARCQVTGKATDTLLGALLEIDATKVVEDYGGMLRGRGVTYLVDVRWTGGEPVFSGILKPGSNGNHVDLLVAAPERSRADRARLEKLLAAGATFTARTDGGTSSARPVTIALRLEGGALTGVSDYARKREMTGQVTGSIREEDGTVAVDLEQTPTPNQVAAPAGRYHLWVIPDESGILLAGYADWAGRNPRYPEPMSFRIDDR